MLFKAKVAVMETMHPSVPTERVAIPMGRFVYAPDVAPPAPAPPREPVPVPDATIAATPTMDTRLREQYQALALELGIEQPGLLKDRALAFFSERGTRLYDHAKVFAYLNDQYGKEIQRPDNRNRWQQAPGQPVRMETVPTWGWRSLRQKDKERERTSYADWRWMVEDRLNGKINQEIAPYRKPLPLPVLLTVKEVSAAFPTAHFYVSDEIQAHEIPVLDPFLLVVIEGEHFIIERWDEPAYRE